MTGRTLLRRVFRSSALASFAAPLLSAVFASDPSAVPAEAYILQEMNNFHVFGSVLYVAAHPDDENTQLITYLARGRDYRTAYLSLTRGDGGQNLLGPEFGDALGVIRTQELLEARHLDGGRQFFSRARDFGYSKDYRQTLAKWDHEQVLSDIVRVIRTFRPDIIITRFSPEPSATHGQHTASAALALEAFRLSGDPTAFPEQLGPIAPWQARRIFWNSFSPGRGAPDDSSPDALKIAIDGTDPVTGESFGLLAARSRAMHKTQGFANFSVAAAGSGPRIESFRLLGGEPARGDIMDGVDTTWGRVAGGPEIGRLAGAIIASFDPKDPEASVPALLGLRGRLAALPSDPLVEEKRRMLDNILRSCVGLSVQTTVDEPEVVPGERLRMRHTAIVRSKVPVQWVAVRYPGYGSEMTVGITLAQGRESAREATRTLPSDTPPGQPYWLREKSTAGMFKVDDPSLIGLPENLPPLPIEEEFVIGGQKILVRDEARFESSEPAGSVLRRPDVIPPVSLSFTSAVSLFAPGSTRNVEVEMVSFRANSAGILRLEAPAGWGIAPSSQEFHVPAVGGRAKFNFAVTAPNEATSGEIRAFADIGGVRYGTQRISIRYSHVPPLLLQPPTLLRAVSLNLAIRGHSVGYLPGAGDSAVASLEQMGYAVTILADSDLNAQKLKNLDAVVIGVRAFNTRKDLADHLSGLFAYVEEGGTVVEQYNTPNGILAQPFTPYDLKLSRDLPRYRVTDENSAVKLLVPGHPAFNFPNRIGPADFAGWVQERGLNFASEWDAAHLTPLIACSDPGEPALEGGLLVAQYGHGYIVYTGLSFFRQLPAGVPGAYRLFANLVSLGR